MIENLQESFDHVINHVLLGGKKISVPLANKIKQEFPTISLTWILNGEGSFLQSSTQGV